LGYFFQTKVKLLLNFDKQNWLGYVLGDFFTNSSGHPAVNEWTQKCRAQILVSFPVAKAANGSFSILSK
jgi:hypothetical protein